jgi:hypothetical protein
MDGGAHCTVYISRMGLVSSEGNVEGNIEMKPKWSLPRKTVIETKMTE